MSLTWGHYPSERSLKIKVWGLHWLSSCRLYICMSMCLVKTIFREKFSSPPSTWGQVIRHAPFLGVSFCMVGLFLACLSRSIKPFGIMALSTASTLTSSSWAIFGFLPKKYKVVVHLIINVFYAVKYENLSSLLFLLATVINIYLHYIIKLSL